MSNPDGPGPDPQPLGPEPDTLAAEQYAADFETEVISTPATDSESAQPVITPGERRFTAPSGMDAGSTQVIGRAPDPATEIIDMGANAKVLDSSSLIYKGVAAGEYPVGITMEYAAHRYIAGGDKNVVIVYPKAGAFLAPEAAAIIKDAPHPEEAKTFFDYLLTKEVQDEIFRQFSRRPARPDAAAVKGLPSLKGIPVLKSFDPLEATAKEKEILRQWKQIILSK